jgi:glutamine amidotransferase
MTAAPSIEKNILVTIIDYDAGNILNAVRAIKHIGFNVVLASKPQEVPPETAILIIPGVGAFGHGIKNIKERGFDIFINNWVKNNKPLVGICLGMQLLFEESCELGQFKGLGYLTGKMQKIPYQIINEKKYPVPHIGWAKVNSKRADLMHSFYFVHSYFATETKANEVLGVAQYGDIQIPAIVQKNNILGFQFHPEKSAQDGLTVLKKMLLELASLQVDKK